MLSGFTASDIVSLAGTIGAAFIALGKFLKWYVDRLDKKTQAAMAVESELRKQIELSFEDRIKNLEVELAAQKEIIRILNLEKQMFLRRIYQLESFIQVSNLHAPEMDGWPPND